VLSGGWEEPAEGREREERKNKREKDKIEKDIKKRCRFPLCPAPESNGVLPQAKDWTTMM
jgi:hypothetical protein